MLHRVFLFGHVLSAFMYLLAHGGSAAAAYRVRRDTSTERVRALLDLSQSTRVVGNVMFLSTVVCGVALGFMGHWWSARWIWVSIVILIIVLAVMGRTVAPHFRRLRDLVGPVLADGTWQRPAREPSADELSRALASGNTVAITALAISGWAAIIWLMLFKPF